MRVHPSALVLLASIAASPVGAVTEAELGAKEGSAGIRGGDNVEPDVKFSELCDASGDVSPEIICPGNLTLATTANDTDCSATHGMPSPRIDEKHCGVKIEGVYCKVDDNSTNDNILGFDCGNGPPDGPCFVNDTMTTYGGGTHSVTCSITDLSNSLLNNATCPFQVVVNDATPPRITCPADETISTSVGTCQGDYDGTASATDNCDTNVEAGIIRLPATLLDPGVTIVTFTATDEAGNNDTCITAVTVEDDEAPTVRCDEAVKLIADLGVCVATNYDDTVTVSDNCDNDPMLDEESMANYTKGETNITHTATDSSGNVGTCTTTVKVVDNESPKIRCDVCDDYCRSTHLFTATDNCAVAKVTCTDGNITTEWTGAELSNPSLKGSGLDDFNSTYLEGAVTCTAEDDSGNTAACDTELVFVKRIKVGVICSVRNATAAFCRDVQDKLEPFDEIESVTVIQTRETTPTLEEIKEFDAVLVFSDASYNDAAALGNNLADAVDAGVGVVTMTFENSAFGTSSLQGRWTSGGYRCLPIARALSTGPHTLDTSSIDPNDPVQAALYENVTMFNGGGSSYRIRSTSGVYDYCRALGAWSDGTVFAATTDCFVGGRINLNFYPPSSNARSDFWDPDTDGATIMKNALVYVACEYAEPADDDKPDTCSTGQIATVTSVSDQEEGTPANTGVIQIGPEDRL